MEKRFEQRKLLKQAQSVGKPLSKCFEEVLALLSVDLSPNTVRSYRLASRNYLRLMGDAGVNQVTAREADFFKTKRSTEVSPYSVNIDLRSLKSLFSTFVRWNYCNSNPFVGIKFIRIVERKIVFFSEDDLRSLISSIRDPQFRSLIIFSYYTGCRLGEIVFLKWDSINLESRTVSVENSENFTTKSKRSRILPINDSLYEVLNNLQSTRKSEYVFPRVDGKPYRRESVSRRFKRLLQRKGFDKKFHFHNLRATYASHLVQRNVPIYSVSRFLGHSSVKVTERYAYLQTQDGTEAVNKLNLFQNVNTEF